MQWLSCSSWILFTAENQLFIHSVHWLKVNATQSTTQQWVIETVSITLRIIVHLSSAFMCAEFCICVHVNVWISNRQKCMYAEQNKPTMCFMLPLWSNNGSLVFLCLLGACSYKQLILSCVFMSSRKYCYSSSWVSVASGSLAVLIHYKVSLLWL